MNSIIPPSAAKALYEVLHSIDWPEIVSEVPSGPEWEYWHTSCRGVGGTPDEALAAWKTDVTDRLAKAGEVDWLLWRIAPEIDIQVDLKREVPVWVVYSRMMLSTSRRMKVAEPAAA